MFISLFEFPGVSAAAILSAGFLECVICAMKHRKRALEENSRLNSNKVVPIEDECPCYDIVTGLILCNIPQFTEVMPVSHGVVVSLKKLNTCPYLNVFSNYVRACNLGHFSNAVTRLISLILPPLRKSLTDSCWSIAT